MEKILEEIFEGFQGNSHNFESKFYDYLSEEIKNYPNKINFLNELIEKINIKTCDDTNCDKNKCYKVIVKPIAVRIIKSKIEELMENKKETKISVDNSINKNIIADSENIHISNYINKGDNQLKTATIIYYAVGIIAGIITVLKYLI